MEPLELAAGLGDHYAGRGSPVPRGIDATLDLFPGRLGRGTHAARRELDLAVGVGEAGRRAGDIVVSELAAPLLHDRAAGHGISRLVNDRDFPRWAGHHLRAPSRDAEEQEDGNEPHSVAMRK